MSFDEPNQVIKVLACDGRTGEQREIGYTGTHVVGNGKSIASFSSSYPSSPQPDPPCNPARPTPTGQDWDWNLRFSISDSTLPLIMTKKVHTKAIIHKLLWFIRGLTSTRELSEAGVRI
ncbi:hypothetical protein PtA15_3A623 [Puccinia triticina]|uniref:Thymidylate synthase/dCMP hydroxymethylase domain-containing protein n=1 Tax=Puccinia triticina TaxID=208348 RepID=A0ABY7CDW6_9BASI|nr:uncharacterized protein PtA15_3A623 [Puccinia triticina]WAQ83254.1 hypothetical protein PtA15_3A623 [Puccinia triticina]